MRLLPILRQMHNPEYIGSRMNGVGEKWGGGGLDKVGGEASPNWELEGKFPEWDGQCKAVGV